LQSIPIELIATGLFLFGLIIGSFLNVVIYRVPRRESIILPASHCIGCGAQVKPYDNIPLLSYAILKGRCRNCKQPISLIYPFVELLTGVLFALAFIKDGLSWSLIPDLAFIAAIIALIFIDYNHRILPNVITYPGLAIAIVVRVWLPSLEGTWILRQALASPDWPDWLLSLVNALVGALVGGGALWFVRWLYFVWKRVEGMGLGDIKMMAMIGAYLGWQLTLLTIFLGSLLGSVVGIYLILSRGYNTKFEMPFGIFLGVAAVIALFAGWPILNWYSGLFK